MHCELRLIDIRAVLILTGRNANEDSVETDKDMATALQLECFTLTCRFKFAAFVYTFPLRFTLRRNFEEACKMTHQVSQV